MYTHININITTTPISNNSGNTTIPHAGAILAVTTTTTTSSSTTTTNNNNRYNTINAAIFKNIILENKTLICVVLSVPLHILIFLPQLPQLP